MPRKTKQAVQPKKPRAPLSKKASPVIAARGIVSPYSKYNPLFCDQLINHRKLGFSYESFAAIIKVNRDTLYAWEKAYPEWALAKSLSYEECLLFWETIGIKGANGLIKGFNPIAYIYTTKNRLQQDFKANPELPPPTPPDDSRTIGQKTTDAVEAAKMYQKMVTGK